VRGLRRAVAGAAGARVGYLGIVTLTQALAPAGPWLGWLTLAGAVAGVCLMFALRGRRLVTSDLTTTQPVRGRGLTLATLVLAVFAAQAVLVVVNLAISLTGYTPSSVQSAGLEPYLASTAGVVYLVLVGPVAEELVFRAALLRHLAPYGANFAIVTQAVLFALSHGNFYQGAFTVVLGIILGYLALRFSWKWAVLVHLANNGLAVASAVYPLLAVVLVLVMLGALAATVAVVAVHRARIRPLVAEGRSAYPHPFRAGWSHPVFIAVAILLVGLAVATTVLAP
jgi:membrane protease YdiL (CAAX protease family)